MQWYHNVLSLVLVLMQWYHNALSLALVLALTD